MLLAGMKTYFLLEVRQWVESATFVSVMPDSTDSFARFFYSKNAHLHYLVPLHNAKLFLNTKYTSFISIFSMCISHSAFHMVQLSSYKRSCPFQSNETFLARFPPAFSSLSLSLEAEAVSPCSLDDD